MSWRNQGITGSNNIPLGSRRRFGDDGPADSPTPPVDAPVEGGLKRGRSPVRGAILIHFSDQCHANNLLTELNPDGTKKRKKRNRWGEATENKAAGLMNLPTAVLGNMTSEQLDAYTLHLRIEEISQKLRINDVVPADGDRQVSPSSFTTKKHSLTMSTDLLRLHRSMTTLVVVSIPVNIDTRRDWKMRDIA